MPFLGLGLHIIIALFFAVHAVRSGQPMYWLLILLSFPLLGSVVYFFAVYMPASRLERGARKVASVATRILDPEREVREARDAFAQTPTAQNQMRLAQALLARGLNEEAVEQYEACLNGPFAADLEIRWGAAQACFACGRFEPAIAHLHTIIAADARFRPEAVLLLLARSQGAVGHEEAAKQSFEQALQQFGSFEVRAEYEIWALGVGDQAVASALATDTDTLVRRWAPHAREMNAQTLRRLNEARAQASRRAAG